VTRQMHMVMLNVAGPTNFMWQHPADRGRFLDADYWDGVARTLEEAKFDAIFFADAQVFFNDTTVRRGGELYMLEPQMLAMSIARATRHLGIGITVSTSLFEPYGLARSLGTLDLLSKGRIAWNVVTSSSDLEARRYGMDALLDRSARYDRADEVLEACGRLWRSFPSEAFVLDRKSGCFMDPDRLDAFHYEGRHVRTQGPLTVPPSPQGRPVIMQAGASERGRQFAARWAEVIFTHQYTLSHMRDFYQDLKARVVAAGRTADDCAILPLITVTVGETEAIARDKNAYVNALVDDETAIGYTSAHLGVDLGRFAPDQPVPELSASVGSLGAYGSLREVSQAEGLTLAQVARRYTLDGLAPEIVGTPEHVADALQQMFEQRGCDGFMLGFKTMPGAVEDFCRMVVPILQERGVYRRNYSATTLRGHLAG
jgi:FMN-dependent oxidoreductase (nitrilotriacetate monooxygenase family)